MGRIPSGLFVLTVRRQQRETGLLVSWVQQCSFRPPFVSIALRRDRPINAWLTEGTVFTLNVLDDTQTDMVAHFGKGFELDEPAFEGLEMDRTLGVAPVLTEALAFLDLRVLHHYETGDHHLLVAEAIAGRLLSEGHPMVHVRKSGFHY